MALVASIHIELGSSLPGFSLPDASDTVHQSGSLSGPQGLLLAVTCNHCPYAIAVWPRLIRHAKTFHQLGVHTVAINPNIHPDYPDDSPVAMQEKIQAWGIDFPYLVDAKQEVAKSLNAQCTPDIYLFDKNQSLYYHGRMDDCWKDESKVFQQELYHAVNAMLEGNPPPTPQHPSIGCSIKWSQ